MFKPYFSPDLKKSIVKNITKQLDINMEETAFPFMTKRYHVVWIGHTFSCIPQMMDIHIISTIIKNASMNISAQISGWVHVFSSLLGMEFLASMVALG